MAADALLNAESSGLNPGLSEQLPLEQPSHTHTCRCYTDTAIIFMLSCNYSGFWDVISDAIWRAPFAVVLFGVLLRDDLFRPKKAVCLTIAQQHKNNNCVMAEFVAQAIAAPWILRFWQKVFSYLKLNFVVVVQKGVAPTKMVNCALR